MIFYWCKFPHFQVEIYALWPEFGPKTVSHHFNFIAFLRMWDLAIFEVHIIRNFSFLKILIIGVRI
jgi:hypothetical protein